MANKKEDPRLLSGLIQSRLSSHPKYSRTRDSDLRIFSRVIAFILLIRPPWLACVTALVLAPFWFCLVLLVILFRAIAIIGRHLKNLFLECGDILTDLIFRSPLL
jgi:hypothetical protein